MSLKQNFYQVLGYAGLIPFWGLAVGSFVIDDPRFISTQLAYAAIILSFLGGAHWPRAVESKCPFYLVLTMLPSIFALGAFVAGLFYPAIALGVFSLLFIAMFVMDKKFLKLDPMPDDYVRFRIILTVLVVLALTLTSFSSMSVS
ncbi:MAG: DUF3429 domain-containing protein [Pseudomonadota bacterium]